MEFESEGEYNSIRNEDKRWITTETANIFFKKTNHLLDNIESNKVFKKYKEYIKNLSEKDWKEISICRGTRIKCKGDPRHSLLRQILLSYVGKNDSTEVMALNRLLNQNKDENKNDKTFRSDSI